MENADREKRLWYIGSVGRLTGKLEKMQYVQVLLNQKTKDWDATFTYAIPPELLAEIGVGSLVLAPFRGKKLTEGVVLKFQRGIPAKLQGKLKPLQKVIQPGVKVSSEEIELAKWLATRFYSTWSEALFSIMPPVPRRGNGTVFIAAERKKGKAGGNLLLLAKDEKRWLNYVDLIKKARHKRQSVQIIFADLMRLKDFEKFIGEDWPEIKIEKYWAVDKASERWQKWLKMRSGKAEVFLGSRLAVLTPPQNLGLLIIDEPEGQGHFEEQSPKYNSKEVANYWREKLGVMVILGDIMPSVGNLYEARHGKLEIIPKRLPKGACEIKLVDMNKERQAISLPLQNAITQATDQKKSILLFVPRRGFGGVTRCVECDFTFNCPHCLVPLKYYDEKNLLICHHCNYKMAVPARCPNCQSTNIKTFGWGTERVTEWLEEFGGQGRKIIQFDSSTTTTNFDKDAIYVATQAAFRYQIEPDLTGVIGADWMLGQPDYAASEATFRTLAHLAIMTKTIMFVQTEQPNSLIYQTLKNGRYAMFWQKLLKERYAAKYPPYGKLVKITVENKDDQKAQSIINELAERISQRLIKPTVIGPIPAYLPMRRDKFRWQLIIKSERRVEVGDLRDLIKGNYDVEYDPVSLL